MAITDERLIQSFCDLEIPKTIRVSPDCEKVLYFNGTHVGPSKRKIHDIYPLAGLDRHCKFFSSSTPGLFRNYAPHSPGALTEKRWHSSQIGRTLAPSGPYIFCHCSRAPKRIQ